MGSLASIRSALVSRRWSMPWSNDSRFDHAPPHHRPRNLAACRHLHHCPGIQERRRGGDGNARAGWCRRPRRVRALCPLWRVRSTACWPSSRLHGLPSRRISIARRCQPSSRPGARNALDCALWDLEAKQAGRPAWQLAGLAEPRPLITAYTLSLADPAAMGEAAGPRPAARFSS